MLALGMSPEEIATNSDNTDFRHFFYDDTTNPWWHPKKAISDASQLYDMLMGEGHGFSDGENFLKYIEGIIEQQLGNKDATFADLAMLASTNPNLKELKLTGTNLTSKKLQIFDATNTPNVRIADAVRITMSFPGAFKAYPLEMGGKTQYFADGGIATNFPMHVFDERKYIPKSYDYDDQGHNPGTLGLLVDSKSEMETRLWNIMQDHDEGEGLFKFMKRVIGGLQIDDANLQPGHRIIQIHDLGVKTLNFKIPEKQKIVLIESGAKAAQQWLYNYRNAAAYSIEKYSALDKKYKGKSAEEIMDIAEGLQTAYEALKVLEVNPQTYKEERLETISEELMFLSSAYNINVVGSAAVAIDKLKKSRNIDALRQDTIEQIENNLIKDVPVYIPKIESFEDIAKLESECFQQLTQISFNILQTQNLINLTDKLMYYMEIEKIDLNNQMTAVSAIGRYIDQIATRHEAEEHIALDIIIARARLEFNTQFLQKYNFNAETTNAMLKVFDATTDKLKIKLQNPEQEMSYSDMFKKPNEMKASIEIARQQNMHALLELKARKKKMYKDVVKYSDEYKNYESTPFKAKSITQIIALNNRVSDYVASETTFFAKIVLSISKRLSIPDALLPNKIVYLKEVDNIKDDVRKYYLDLQKTNSLPSLIYKEREFKQRMDHYQKKLGGKSHRYWSDPKSELSKIISQFKPSDESERTLQMRQTSLKPPTPSKKR
jgi:hypothetical protein